MAVHGRQLEVTGLVKQFFNDEIDVLRNFHEVNIEIQLGLCTSPPNLDDVWLNIDKVLIQFQVLAIKPDIIIPILVIVIVSCLAQPRQP